MSLPSPSGGPASRGPAAPELSRRFAVHVYRWRWVLATLSLGLVAASVITGFGHVAAFSSGVAGIADTSNGSGAVKPLFFDPGLDIWYGDEDEVIRAFRAIEDDFVAEDFVMASFEEKEHEFGVFSRESLATIARLTEEFLTVPGVRHVRSLTYNPWIRWGTIEEGEEGLLIGDLVVGDPRQLTDDEIIERMVAVLGAERTARRVGEARVRAVLGPGERFEDYQGEPLLLGMIIDETGSSTAIQVQLLRPRANEEVLENVFESPALRSHAANLHRIEVQRTGLIGLEHFIRLEKGLAIPTPGFADLEEWIESLEAGEERDRLRLELSNPNRNFMRNRTGELVRKFYEYDAEGSEFVDRSESGDVVTARAGFDPAPRSKFDLLLAGGPLFERNFETTGKADAKFVPLMFLIITLMLFLVFRSIPGVILPLTVIFGSVLAMLGVTFAADKFLNNLTMMAPNMLTAVGMADAIHLVAGWAVLRNEYDDKRSLIIEVISRNALPVFLTSATTAVGFYSLTVNTLAPVRMLGEAAALGTVFAWILSMAVVPALLSLVSVEKRHRMRVVNIFTQERSARFIGNVLRHRTAVLVSLAFLFAIAVAGIFKVEIDTDFRAMFPASNPTMSSMNWIEERMGGVRDVEIVFTGRTRGSEASELTEEEEEELRTLALREFGAVQVPAEFERLSAEDAEQLARLRARQADWNAARIGVSIEFLDAVQRFEARLREEMALPDSDISVVTDLISPLDTLRKMHQVQNENAPAFYRVPSEADVPEELRTPTLSYDEWLEEWSLTPAQSGSSLVAQYYLQYESGARPAESLSTQLSADRTHFRMQGRVRQASSSQHERGFRRIEEIARTEFPQLAGGSDTVPALADLEVSGKAYLFARTPRFLALGFIESMSIALVCITVLIGLIFRSWRLALISLIPNVLPILLPLSVYGLLGVSLDGPSILVASVALGVCVDDTIHFFTKFVRAREAGLDSRDSLVHVLVEAGTAMTVTTVVLVIGFGTLLLSDFKPNYQMGTLAGLMIALAWVADFVITSAVLSFYPSLDTNPSRS